ncbi:MAG: hypothetical protein IJA55_05850 [Clostridia bacterium]|nr:hypothetical protein [Clostridia bacterium]
MIVKAVGIVLVTLFTCTILRNTAPVFIPFISICAGIVILYFCFENVSSILEYYYTVCRTNEFGDYFKVMLKGLGIAYVSGLGADLCRDCGESRLAGRIEFAAKTEILVIAFPFIKSLIELSESILIL